MIELGSVPSWVGALVDAHLHLERADAAVEVDGCDDVQGLVVRMAGSGQVLGAILDPLHRRPPKSARRVPDEDLLADRVRLLPERTADVATAHRDRAFVECEQRGQRTAQRIRVLERRVHRQVFVRPLGQHGTTFHRKVRLAALPDRSAHHSCCAGEVQVGVAVLERLVVDHVGLEVVEQRDDRVVERIVEQHDRVERLEVDHHCFGSIFRTGTRGGDHHADDVTGEADAIGAHRVDHRHGEPRWPDSRSRPDATHHVGAGPHRHDAGQGARFFDIDAGDPGVRPRAAHERHVQQPGGHQVVDEAPAPGEQARVLDTTHTGSGPPLHQRPPTSTSSHATPTLDHPEAGNRTTNRAPPRVGESVTSIDPA